MLENSWFNYIVDQKKSSKNETPYCTARLVLDLVGNPEDTFFRDTAF